MKIFIILAMTFLTSCLGVGTKPEQPAPSPTPKPIASYDVVTEVFDGWASENKRVVGAIVEIDDDKRTTDGNGFTHMFIREGVHRLTVSKEGYETYETQFELKGQRVNVFPSEIDPSIRVEMKAKFVRRSGVVRKCGKAVCDDQGSFNALGATLMWGNWGYKYGREKLEKNLAFLRDNGFHYIRVLGVVGRQPYWAGRESDWRWSDYDAVIAGLTDLAYDKYGLRVEWTLIGDGDQMIPNASDRFKLVDRFLAMSKGREHKIMHFEIANEAWQNGFSVGAGYQQLKELSKYMADRTEILVAASAPSGSEYDGDYCRELSDLSGGDMDTFHYDRSTRMVDGFWRHVRQPWESCSRFSSNNEPMGPGSSVAKTNDPELLVAAAMTSYLSGVAMYVWHTEAGVWGGTHTELEGKSDLYENPSGTQFKAMQKILPQGLAGWQRQNSYNNPNHPLLIFAGGHPDTIWSQDGGYPDGVVRAYGTVNGNEFVVLPIGIKNFVKMQAKKAMEVDAYNIVTGEKMHHFDLSQGAAFTLTGLGSFLLKGKLK